MKKKVHVFFVFLMLAFLTVPSVWAVNITTTGQSVNVPCSGKTEAIVSSSVTSFKVYDNGGSSGNYSNSCNGSLVIKTSKTGFGWKITGSATLYDNEGDNLYIYNYDQAEFILYTRSSLENIGMLYSTTGIIEIKFVTDNSYTAAGFDFTIESVQLYNVSVTGSSNADPYIKTPFKSDYYDSRYSTFAEGAYLSVYPGQKSGYIMNAAEVKKSNGTLVKPTIEDGYINFKMPASAVTVTPSVVSKSNPGYFYMMNGTISYEIPAGVTSFKVYDDGGSAGNYSNVVNSFLKLTAPTDYTLKVTGTVTTDGTNSDGVPYDYLAVFNGLGKSLSNRVAQKFSSTKDVPVNIGTIQSSGNTMTLQFHSDGSETSSGLDLTVTVIPPYHSISVDPYSNGTVTVQNSAETGSTVTIKVKPNSGYMLKSLSVPNVTLTKQTDTTWTFTMPNNDVRIYPEFISDTYSITKKPVTGGSLSGASSAKVNSIVSLTASPQSGYMLKDVEVKSASGNILKVNKNDFTNFSFKMPIGDVTVTPSWTQNFSASGGIYVDMRATGKTSISLSENIKSFKIYDDGGRNGDYSNNCDGTLSLTAPTGYVLELSGNIYSYDTGDYLTVYDASSASGTKLLDQARSINGKVMSSGRYMTINFKSGSSGVSGGLDLTVTLRKLALDLESDGNGKKYVNMLMKSTATLNISANDTSIKIYDDGGKDGNYGNNVNGTLVLTAPTGYAIELKGMVKTNYLSRVQTSTCLYYTPICGDYGCFDGCGEYAYDYTCDQEDKLSVYDGANTSATPLLNGFVGCTASGGSSWYSVDKIMSSGNKMTLNFRSGSSGVSDGLDLTVTLRKLAMDLQSDGNGGRYVNMFVGNKGELNLSASDTSIKIYDDGGKDGNYSNKANGSLTLTAPTGYVIELKGKVKTNYLSRVQTSTCLYYTQVCGDYGCYDGCKEYAYDYTCDLDDKLSVYDGADTSTTRLLNGFVGCTASGGSSWRSVGKIMSSSNKMTLNFKSGSSGVSDGLELTATLRKLEMSLKNDGSGKYVDMLVKNTATLNISANDTSFRIYDDGGKNENYSSNANGWLRLTAPTGYAIELKGDINTYDGDDYLTVYDGAYSYNGTLLNKVRTIDGKIISSGRYMLLNFRSGSSGESSGLNLTVTIRKLAMEVQYGSVNMLVGNTATLAIPDTIKTFKIYDDGGYSYDYTNNNNGTLVLTAPEGNVIELTGSIKTPAAGSTSQTYACINPDLNRVEECVLYTYSCDTEDNLNVYDGADTLAKSLLHGAYGCNSTDASTWTSVGTLRSSGNKMTLNFKSGSSGVSNGLDLTVKVVSTKHAIEIASVANGMVKSDKASANAGETVTLTAHPSLNCMMSGISVKDSSSNKEISVTGGWYSGNKMTFIMPDNNVTVTPNFTTDLSAEGGLYINMQPGITTVNVSKTVKSFYVYDNGGKEKNYRDYSNDTLVLQVPAGYRMRLTGTMVAENMWDLLRVYDGENTDATQLFGKSAFVSGVVTDIGDTVVSSGENMTITFNSDDGKNYDGYALKVTVEQAHYAVAVQPASGGEVYVKGGDTLGAEVLLLAFGTGVNRLSGIQVVDKNGNTVKAPIFEFDHSKFTMPQGGVTVTPTFTSDLTAEGGLHLDMVMRGNETANIPEGVRSFKLYDNGGANGDYENRSSDTLTITAPEGSYLNVTGSINVESGHYDSLYIFDGTTIGTDTLFSGTCSGSSAYDIGSIRSKGRSLTFRFKSDGSGVRSGLDLTVTVLKRVHFLTIANIPQQSYTGDSIKPALTIKNGTNTLVENRDYRLQYINNVNSGTATVGIIGMGNYVGDTAVTFTIGPKETKFAAIKLLEDQRGKGVAIDGSYNGDEAIMITDSIEVDYVDYSRNFSTSGYSTIVLPFDVSTSNVSGLQKVAAFSEITTNDAGRLVAVMSLVWKDSVGVPDTTLKANTPYMVLMNDGNFAVDGGVTLVPTVEPVVRSGTWEFRGTLAKRVWAEGDADLGRVYGFSAEERPDQNIKIGQFVKAGAGAWIRPGRAYLINVPETQSSHVGAGRPAIAALPSVVLPEDMDVVIEEQDGSTTFVGRINARTGEFVNMKARMYDLKGRNVNGKPRAKGMFIRK